MSLLIHIHEKETLYRKLPFSSTKLSSFKLLTYENVVSGHNVSERNENITNEVKLEINKNPSRHDRTDRTLHCVKNPKFPLAEQ